MANYPIRFSAQLRQHLRALRKKRQLTQAEVASKIGVSQARIAEIEANPGVVSFDQLMQLFAALGATITLEDDSPPSVAKTDSHADPALDQQVKKSAKGRKDDLYQVHFSDDALRGTPNDLLAMQRGQQYGYSPAMIDELAKAQKLLNSYGSLDELRTAMDRDLKNLDSIKQYERAHKAQAAISAADALRNKLDTIQSDGSYRKILDHMKKGSW
jgi:transcriptional regulator with XRE-family HTH domain